ncbi:hypothetical protein [Mycolicibacterium aichiense]|uniref:Uncharacterized protein n=1 Tax=Mycolicibacterium aichiense TaxID=1799 RepID=A0AAD1MC52_9MYCO|nr:hypothetical protein [Mycolicibacterium aichiense]MCV7018489.1 hypothetical protein [Mycolicibacterium aichiense]BBX07245.1 hypothetical protein MAIC_20480 [Mycolicibacterium aichiense]
MLSAVVLTPSAPVLVPELAGAAAAEVAEFRDAALAAAAALPDRWVAIGAGAADQTIAPDTRGTFAGYGVDVPVALSPDAPAGVSELPLCALFTGWLRGQANPAARAQVRVYDTDHDADRALEFGRLLRAEIDATDEPVGVLVVADGANTLTPPAPGGYDPDAAAVQATLDDALAAGDSAALSGLPGGIVGRVAYQVLAGLVGAGPREATELVRGAPYGVGYFVGTWRP